MTVHNHGIDPSCREVRLPNGKLQGECLDVPPAPTPEGVEHFTNCPCGRCQIIRREAHDKRWAGLNVIDRLQESLNAKIEGDQGRLPERGMLNLADVQALINLAKEKP